MTHKEGFLGRLVPGARKYSPRVQPDDDMAAPCDRAARFAIDRTKSFTGRKYPVEIVLKFASTPGAATPANGGGDVKSRGRPEALRLDVRDRAFPLRHSRPCSPPSECRGALAALGLTQTPRAPRKDRQRRATRGMTPPPRPGQKEGPTERRPLGMFWPDRSRSGREAALTASDAHDR